MTLEVHVEQKISGDRLGLLYGLVTMWMCLDCGCRTYLSAGNACSGCISGGVFHEVGRTRL